MRSVPYQDVLWGTARLLGMSPSTDLSAARAATITQYLNSVVKAAWNFDWWPEWTTCEERHFRPDYTAGEFIEAGTERFHVGSQTYYQALRQQAAATEAPATYDPASGTWTENSAWWAACEASYSAPVQTDGEALAVGDQRLDLLSRRVYQVHTAHTASGTAVDTAQAGVLTPFNRSLSFEQEGQTPIGAVKGVHRRDPRVHPDRPGTLNHRVNQSGLVVLPGPYVVPVTVWVEFRLRPPQYTSTPWVQPTSGNGYDLGALVYYQGQVFRSAFGDNEAVVDGVTNWIEVGFPEILAEHCQLAAAALQLTDQKQQSRALALRQQAQEELERVRDQELGSQQEPDTAEVLTYGR